MTYLSLSFHCGRTHRYPASRPVWLKVAGIQAVVRWQVSQACVVGTCVAVLPRAWLPLWHVTQLPGVTPVWLKVAGIQPVVR